MQNLMKIEIKTSEIDFNDLLEKTEVQLIQLNRRITFVEKDFFSFKKEKSFGKK